MKIALSALSGMEALKNSLEIKLACHILNSKAGARSSIHAGYACKHYAMNALCALATAYALKLDLAAFAYLCNHA